MLLCNIAVQHVIIICLATLVVRRNGRANDDDVLYVGGMQKQDDKEGKLVSTGNE